MSIVIVTDAWYPQVNGVVRTLNTTANQLREWGHDVDFITPQGFRTLPLPTYPDIRLALFPKRRVFAELDRLQPDAVHIATEGPLGWAARRWCMKRGVTFTTSYHTQFPEYVSLRAPIPLSWSYALIRHFHAPATCVLVPTPSQARRLRNHCFDNVDIWSRGVDTEMFRPCATDALDHLPKPISVYMGRVAVEKNLDAFLEISLPGSKVVIGDGPDLEKLKRRYPDAHFLGFKFGNELSELLSACDVFVFPSRTDTFGLVLIEAMACGLPVAAFPVTGPIDVVKDGFTGVLDEDLRDAIIAALNLDRSACRQHALRYNWETATSEFLQHLCTPVGESYNGAPLRVSSR